MTETPQKIDDLSMLELFRLEVEGQAGILNNSLLALEAQPQSPQVLESLMRAAHSIKGAARIVEIDAVVNLAHVMEDCFVAAQNHLIILNPDRVDLLLQGVDFLLQISQIAEENLEHWLSEQAQEIEVIKNRIATLRVTGEGAASRELREEEAQSNSSEITPPSAPLSIVNNNSEELTAVNSILAPEGESLQKQQSSSLEVAPPSESPHELSNFIDTSMLDLFRQEVAAQVAMLTEGLVALETQPHSGKVLESLMRAAHSIKGASRIVGINPVVNLAHLMEDCFVAAQNQTITLEADRVDSLLQGVDLLLQISQIEPGEINRWLLEAGESIEITRQQIAALLQQGAVSAGEIKTARSQPTSQKPEGNKGKAENLPIPSSSLVVTTPAESSLQSPVSKQTQPAPETTSLVKGVPSNLEPAKQPTAQSDANSDRVVRVSAENLNRIMGLAGESLIEANWLQPFADSLTILKKRQLELSKMLEHLQDALIADNQTSQKSQNYLEAARLKEQECREILGDRLNELELYARRTSNLSDRLYREVIASHMRPFADGVQGFPRMIRDLARKLGKQVKLEILGKSTPVDRDILKKLEAPLTHILRNSIDHGLETPQERLAAGKPAEGTVRLEATHRGGMLSITISDDGKGIDAEKLRQKVVNKHLSPPEVAAQMTDGELIEFLFLPGFSTAQQVTEISGRGVGLDIARSMAQEVGGTVRAHSQCGKGMTFHFQLPLTLSVVRTLLVEISGEPYAFPLAKIEQIVMVNPDDIYSVENRQYFTMDQKNIGLVAAYQVLELKEPIRKPEVLPVVTIGEQSDYYGVVVDRFLGEYDLVVRPLDPRLGKVQDISAAALMGDGTPILIVDVSDLIHSVDALLNHSKLKRFGRDSISSQEDRRKKILIVEDSITVREMERKLLQNKGYRVDVAVNGMEGWYAISSSDYDLVISDVDMPRMNGIELIAKIKSNPKLSSIPVIIVSYKDREEDRLRGLEAGADYYLTKTSFHDNTLLKAVIDLIGN
ncbi:MAG: response regulator [Actinomycetota bacterium]